jgi:hypothetical protein
MRNSKLDCHIAVISHKRPQNIKPIIELIGDCTFYVNKGELQTYLNAGAKNVVECGDNICQARNKAIKDAREHNLPSIQVSDDLKSLKTVRLENGKHIVEKTDFISVVDIMVTELLNKGYFYGGVAVTTNRLNYTGQDFSYDKLIVCDLVCMMPSGYFFDEEMYLKEDYDMTITQLLETGGVVRCNQFLCDFPHRENDGGANTYRNNESEDNATKRIYGKWGELIKPHSKREGQISLNYNKIRNYDPAQSSLF